MLRNTPVVEKIAVNPLVERSSVSLTHSMAGPHQIIPASIVHVDEICCGVIVTASQPPSPGCILAIVVRCANKRLYKQRGGCGD